MKLFPKYFTRHHLITHSYFTPQLRIHASKLYMVARPEEIVREVDLLMCSFFVIARESMLSSQPRPAGVTVTTIDFPSPHPTSFAVAGAIPAQGAPQVTTAGTPQEQPQWNQSLFFIGDESSLFTVTSALVIEYYPASLGKTSNMQRNISG